MSDFSRDTDPNVLVDLFGPQGKDNPGPQFGMTATQPDIFSSTTDTTTLAPVSTTDTTTLSPTSTTDTTTLAPTNADILGEGAQKGGRKPKYNFQDASGYFKDRMESGKFVKIEEEMQDGTKQLFVPSTPEDFDEVIEMQVHHRLEQEKKTLDKAWYSSKSPAWQAVARYADMVDDPSLVIPFIQGVKTIQSVANINEDEVAGAEQIVRLRMEQRGDPKEVIDSQIDALKTTEKLVPTAKQYKPVIIQQEQQELQRQTQEQQRAQLEWNTMVTDIRDKAIKAIETPLFGKEKLKQDEKAAIYDLIAAPSDEDGGYGIFRAIDNLFDKRDFETLRQVALLLFNKEAYQGYYGKSVANSTAASLQRKLTVATDNRQSGGDQDADDNQGVATRNSFTRSARFGR